LHKTLQTHMTIKL